MKPLPLHNHQMVMTFEKQRKRYFNTVNENPGHTRIYEITAKAQDDLVFSLLTGGAQLTADEIQKHLQAQGKNILLTSIRRALTNLMNGDYIVKTGDKRKGSYGRNALVWKMKPLRFK